MRDRGWEVTSLSRRDGCDVSDEAQVRGAFARFDALDALVHCAQVLIKRPFAEMSASDWDGQLGAGLRGAFLCSREAFRLMRGRGGSIVVLVSPSGLAWPRELAGLS